MKRSLHLGVMVCALLALAGGAAAETWTWTYTPAAGEAASGEVTPLKYGKTWAWTLEIDDSPKTTLTVAQPLLANYYFTDAPPGVSGGNVLPLVGAAGLMCIRVEGNSAYLSWDDVHTLMAAGWGVYDHGYWHTGNHWDPSAFLEPDQFRRELYWAQQIIGKKLWNSQRSAFILDYPNGDWHYADYMGEFGLRAINTPPLEGVNVIGRNNLDGLSTSDALKGLPAAPAANDFVVDFTHGIAAAPSDNYTGWQVRLATIDATWGAGGTDEVWCAPSEEIVEYFLARPQAQVTVDAGVVSLTLPPDAPAAALTIRIDGVDPSSQMTAPPGGLLYRSGTTAWVTTPLLNADQAGPPLPDPQIELVYEGPFDPAIRFAEPILFAGARVHVLGGSTAINVEMLRPDGTSEMLDMQRLWDWTGTGTAWGVWAVLPTLPDLDPVLVEGLNLSPTSGYGTMEVYAVVIVGDFNGDGIVTGADYVVWANTFGNDGSPGKDDLRADANGDGVVSGADYVAWANNFGEGWPQTGNRRPIVGAGEDQVVYMPQFTASLSGSATDDGKPDPPGALSVLWSVQSGPAGVSFSDAASPATTVSFPGAGTYVLRLTAGDGELTAYDEVTVVVEPEPTNQPPVVDAGSNASATWPINSVSLSGSVSDDGLGNPPGTLTAAWSQVSGPGEVTFAAPASLATTAMFSLPGTYILRLTADDGELSAYDETTVIIWDGTGPALQIITPAGAGSVAGYQAMGGFFDAQPFAIPQAGATTDAMGTQGSLYTMDGRSAYIDFGPDYAELTITEVWLGLKLYGVDPNGVAPVTFWSSSLHATYNPAGGDVAAGTFGLWDWTADTHLQSWQRVWMGGQTPPGRYYIMTFDGTQSTGNRVMEMVFVGTVTP